jgi:hypothetical protein
MVEGMCSSSSSSSTTKSATNDEQMKLRNSNTYDTSRSQGGNLRRNENV